MEARHSLALKFFFGSEGCWSGRRDLNPRPPVPQTGALTGLRHAPTGTARTRTTRPAADVVLTGVSVRMLHSCRKASSRLATALLFAISTQSPYRKRLNSNIPQWGAGASLFLD